MKIKQLRQMLGLSQIDFAKELGIPQNTLSNYERGRREPPILFLKDLANKYRVTTDYLTDSDLIADDRVADALKGERKAFGFTLKDLSEETKIPEKDLENYEEGLEPINLFLLKKICDVYGKSIYQFYSDNDMYDEYIPEPFNGDVDAYEAFEKARDEDGMRESWARGPAMDAQPSASTDTPKLPNIEPYNPTMVPIVGTIAAGTPILAEENIEGYAPLQDKKADFALTVKGDSMIGDNIHPGDIVFIKQQPTVEIGEIAAVLIDGDATLKHFYRDGDSVTLVSSNTKYKPMVYHKGDCDEFRILGKAVAYLHDLE